MPYIDDWGTTVAHNRVEAIRLNLPFYKGATCQHGHKEGLRYTSTRACRECRELQAMARTKNARKADRTRKARLRARKAIDALASSPYGFLLCRLVGFI
jgi:hypothetical protein